MASSKLSEAFIEIAVHGITAAKTKMQKFVDDIKVTHVPVEPSVKEPKQQAGAFKTFQSVGEKVTKVLDQIREKFDKIGSSAAKGFGIGTASVLGFVRVASPGDFMKFEAALARVSVQIGSLFLPVIRSLTKWFNQLADALNKLTPEQRRQIGEWAKYTLIFLGVTAVVSKLGGLLVGLTGGLLKAGLAAATLGKNLVTALSKAPALLGKISIATGKATSGIGNIFKVLTSGSGKAIRAEGGLLSMFGKMGVGAGGAAAGAEGLAGSLGAVGASLGPILAVVAAIVAIDAALVGVAAIGVTVAGRWGQIREAAQGVFEGVKKAAQAVWSAVRPIFVLIGNVVAQVFDRIASVAKQVLGHMTRMWTLVGETIKSLMPDIEAFADELLGAFSELWDAIQPVIDEIYNGLYEAFKVLLPIIKEVISIAISGFKELVHEIRVVARVLAELRKNPFKIFKAGELIDQAEAEIKKYDEERKAKQNAKPKDKEPGPIQVYKPEIMSISDAMRKAQTAMLGESPEIAAARERIRIAKESQGNLQRIEKGIGTIAASTGLR